MTRRAPLALIAGASLDPERLLWQPGRKLISIPKPVVVHWNTGPIMTDRFGISSDFVFRAPRLTYTLRPSGRIAFQRLSSLPNITTQMGGATSCGSPANLG